MARPCDGVSMRCILAGLAALALFTGCSKPPPKETTTVDTSTPVATVGASASSASAGVASAAAPSTTASSAAPSGPPKDANVLLISVDSMRADMPWAGYERPIAPRLTELEKSAVSFTRAYSISSYTSMSLGGLLGGKLPSELKRSGYFFGQYKDNLFFPKLLQSAKVRTLGVHAHGYFKDAGFEQGFDKWEVVPNIKFDNTTDKNITSPQSEEIAEKILGDAANDGQRFFFWAHFLDPHDLYLAHDGIGPYGKSERDKYDAEVTFTDKYIAKLLDFVATKSWASRTIIIVTSDHGEAFGEHQQTRHGFEVWENLVHVPMFVVAPGAKAKRVDEPRSAIDLAPTICDLLGVAPDAGFEGKSLVKEIYGEPATPRDVWIDLPMTSDNDFRRALVRGKNKFTCYNNANNCRLFDLEKDPTEEHPISTGDTYKELWAAYKEHAKGLKEITPYSCGPGCLNKAYLNKNK